MKVTVKKQYVITCDYCYDSLSEYSRDKVLEWAKNEGWKIHKGQNICPTCWGKLVLK